MSDDDRKPLAQVKTVIDGREVTVQRDRWALDVAREMGISIPTLCNHPALTPYGACRLCVVQVTKGKWTWLTTSCDLPIREGLSISTDAPAVVEARKMALEMLWTQAPDAKEIRDLARQMGVEKPRFDNRLEDNKCILCGLCVRVCEKILGDSAIHFSHRGAERDVTTPFGEPSETCIGCRACEMICPTGHIVSRLEGSALNISTWNTELEMVRCHQCGCVLMPVKELEFIRARMPEHLQPEQLCQACRRQKTAKQLSDISTTSGWTAGQQQAKTAEPVTGD